MCYWLALLLSTAVSSTVIAPVPCSEPPTSPCGLPAEFTNVQVVDEAGIQVTFAAQHEQYWPGDTIYFAMQFENIGSESYCLNWNMSPLDYVFVLPPPYETLEGAPLNDLPWMYPDEWVPGAGPGLGLEPGECRTYTYEWNPVLPEGEYVVLAGLVEPTFDEQFGVFHLPANGISLRIAMNVQVPVTSTTMGVLKHRFR